MNGESRYLSFSGLRVHFQVSRPEGTVKNRMLLLASPLINCFHWRKLVPELLDLGCLCVLADLPGFGQSDPRAPQTNTQRANMLWGVLDEVDAELASPLSMWHLAGHGLSCGTVLRMGTLFPDSVKTQIHIAPTFTFKTRDPGGWYDANIPDERRFQRLIERWAGYPLDDYVVDRMRAPLLRRGAKDAFERLLKYTVTPPKHGMGFCPTMALMGGRDPLWDETCKQDARALLPDAERHNIRSAGHFPMETHSRALRDYLRGWLKYND